MDEAAALVEAAWVDEAVVTPLVAGALVEGQSLVGLEHRVKTLAATADRLARARAELGYDKRPTDMVRYTVLVGEEAFWAEAEGVCARLAQSLPPVAGRTWRSFFLRGNPYYGLHTWWQTRQVPMAEVQFHTPASYALKLADHPRYTAYRDPATGLEERRRIWRERVAAWDQCPIPPGRPAALAGVTLELRRFLEPEGPDTPVRSVAVADLAG
jgi:hypothetical protein